MPDPVGRHQARHRALPESVNPLSNRRSVIGRPTAMRGSKSPGVWVAAMLATAPG